MLLCSASVTVDTAGQSTKEYKFKQVSYAYVHET
jgi:hypothetical protein